jgi:O-antigen/teichoic acid export membrane protein
MLGLAALAAAGFYRLDQVLVQGIAGAEANGLYGSASRVVFTATAASAIVLNAYFPALASNVDQLQRYRGVLKQALVFSGLVGLAGAVLLFLFAGPIVRVLYGTQFGDAVPLLRILSAVVLFNGLSVTGLYSASALGRERWTLLIVALMAAAVVVAGLLTIPSYGAIAAAWISSVAECVLAALLLGVSWDVLSGRATERVGAR